MEHSLSNLSRPSPNLHEINPTFQALENTVTLMFAGPHIPYSSLRNTALSTKIH